MDEKEIPASLIYTIADIAADTHFASRHMVQRVDDPQFGALLHPGLCRNLTGSPPRLRGRDQRLEPTPTRS